MSDFKLDLISSVLTPNQYTVWRETLAEENIGYFGESLSIATSRTLVCAQVGFATSWTLGLGFGIDFDFIMALNTIAIDLNTQ